MLQALDICPSLRKCPFIRTQVIVLSSGYSFLPQTIYSDSGGEK